MRRDVDAIEETGAAEAAVVGGEGAVARAEIGRDDRRGVDGGADEWGLPREGAVAEAKRGDRRARGIENDAEMMVERGCGVGIEDERGDGRGPRDEPRVGVDGDGVGLVVDDAGRVDAWCGECGGDDARGADKDYINFLASCWTEWLDSDPEVAISPETHAFLPATHGSGWSSASIVPR